MPQPNHLSPAEEALAAILKEEHEHAHPYVAVTVASQIAKAYAKRVYRRELYDSPGAGDDAQFKRGLFLNACGLTGSDMV